MATSKTDSKLTVIVGLPVVDALPIVKEKTLKTLLQGKNVADELSKWRKAAPNRDTFAIDTLQTGESWIGFEVATISNPYGLEKEDVGLETIETCSQQFETLFGGSPRIAVVYVSGESNKSSSE